MQRNDSSTVIYREFFGSPDKPELPYELILMILSYINPNEIPTLSLVCSAWYTLANHNQLWRERFQNRYQNTYEVVQGVNDIDWRTLHRNMVIKEIEVKTALKALDDYISATQDMNTFGMTTRALAAETLRDVVVHGQNVSLLDTFSREYQSNDLKPIYDKLNELNLIRDQDNKYQDVVIHDESYNETQMIKRARFS